MRYSRQNKILELIANNEIETQDKLASMLKEEGFEVTQATISRDIKELHLDMKGNHFSVVDYGAVTTDAKMEMPLRLQHLYTQLKFLTLLPAACP